MVYRFFHLLCCTTYIISFPICDSVLHRKLATSFLWVFRLPTWLSILLSVRMEKLDFHWRTFMKFDIWVFLKNLSIKFKFRENLSRITNTSREDQNTFQSHLPQVFVKRELFQTKIVEKIKTHISCSITFYPISCRRWDNVKKYCSAEQARWQYSVGVFYAEYLRLKTHSQNI